MKSPWPTNRESGLYDAGVTQTHNGELFCKVSPIQLWLGFESPRPSGSVAPLARRVSISFYLYERIIKRRSRSQIGQSLGSHVIRVASVARQLLPPHRQGDDDSRPRLFADARLESEFAAVVENAHAVAVLDVANGGVYRMDFQMRLFLGFQEGRQVCEARIEEVVRRRRDDGQRIFLRQFRRGLRRFARRDEGRQRVNTLL